LTATDTTPKSGVDALRALIPDTTLARDAMKPELASRIAELGLEKNCREHEEQGYTVIENVADPELTLAMREFHIKNKESGKPANMLLRQNPLFCDAVLNPKLLAMAEYSIGEGALISQVTGSVREQGAMALPLHADQNWMPSPFPEHNYLLTFCWVHDEFTKEAGATKVVPGTHVHRRHPTYDEIAAEDGAIAIEAPFNSVALWDGSVWHGNWQRTIPGERVVTHITYGRLALRPVEDYTADADGLIDAHGPAMARLMGRDDFLSSPTGADYSKIAATFAMAKT
jgi:ectoine hydroxylase-related dioxygenase (phytanoyl-CoA dioxygenase family)